MSDAMLTDLYEASMALLYLEQDMTAEATFSLFVRDLPPDRGFLVSAGLESVLDFLERFEVDDEDVETLAPMLERPVEEVAPLRGLRFTGDVWAVPEGRVVLASEPLLEVTAPLPQAQLVETFLLNQVSHQTALASKAVRCVLAAQGAPVVDFGLRRSQGAEAGMHAARAAAIAGFSATSNVAAAARYGLPATGTMAHSFVEAFPSEAAAFQVFADGTRGPVTLLVDTYDTERGLARAAEVLAGLADTRQPGVRLDSGDLGGWVREARLVLDAAGLDRARIVVSGGLDEHAVDALVTAGVPVDVFAVGTKVATSADAPYLDAAYKLVEYDGRHVMKLSTAKVTLPGPKQVFRRPGLLDVLGTREEEPPEGASAVLEHVMHEGRRTGPTPASAAAVQAASERLRVDLETAPTESLRVRAPVLLHPVLSLALARRTEDMQGNLWAQQGL